MEIARLETMESECVSRGSNVFCSEKQDEPLPGTAKPAKVVVALEHPNAWGRDVMDGHTFGEELTEQLAVFLKKHGAKLQLIRKPGREGQQIERRNVFIAFLEQEVVEHLTVDTPEDVLGIDISAPGASGGNVVDHPVILICTHGKRDRCCALKGRPVVMAVEDKDRPLMVWESSHLKGHRFAPSIMALPWGFNFGRLAIPATKSMIAALSAGEFFVPGNRGRSCDTPAEQVAEVAVAEMLVTGGETLPVAALHATGNRVVHEDGRAWDVRLEEREVPGVIASCGDAPKTGTSLVAVDISPAG